MTSTTRLTKLTRSAMIFGVCAGFARFLGWDVTAVRIVWALVTVFTALVPGILAYLICALIMPPEDA